MIRTGGVLNTLVITYIHIYRNGDNDGGAVVSDRGL